MTYLTNGHNGKFPNCVADIRRSSLTEEWDFVLLDGPAGEILETVATSKPAATEEERKQASRNISSWVSMGIIPFEKQTVPPPLTEQAL